MEASEVKSLINALNEMSGSENKGFLKTLTKNKYFLGSVVIAGGVTFANVVKNISLTSITTALLPKSIFDVSLAGVPLGAMTMKLLGITIAGTLVAEAFKVYAQIKEGKKSVGQVLFDEAIMMLILIFSFVLLGKLGVDLVNTANSIPVF
jgi:hypothetical protein